MKKLLLVLFILLVLMVSCVNKTVKAEPQVIEEVFEESPTIKVVTVPEIIVEPDTLIEDSIDEQIVILEEVISESDDISDQDVNVEESVSIELEQESEQEPEVDEVIDWAAPIINEQPVDETPEVYIETLDTNSFDSEEEIIEETPTEVIVPIKYEPVNQEVVNESSFDSIKEFLLKDILFSAGLIVFAVGLIYLVIVLFTSNKKKVSNKKSKVLDETKVSQNDEDFLTTLLGDNK